MNKGQHIGLSFNVLGLILFVVWFILRNRLSTTLSIIFAVIFLGFLLASIFILIRATRQSNQSDSQ